MSHKKDAVLTNDVVGSELPLGTKFTIEGVSLNNDQKDQLIKELIAVLKVAHKEAAGYADDEYGYPPESLEHYDEMQAVLNKAKEAGFDV